MAMRRIPSLNWLRVFEAAARHQSFARAAEQLGMSSAAVSQQIKALEVHFKKPLFIRKPHCIELSDNGRAFLPTVQHALNSVEMTAAGLFGSLHRESLSVYVTLVFANGWLIPRLADFQQKNPQIHLRIATHNHYAADSSWSNDLEIVFGHGPHYGTEGDFLFQEQLFPVALPATNALIKVPADMLQFRLINLSEHHTGWMQVFNRDTEECLDQADFIFTDNSTTALAMAAAGLGIALARVPACDGLYQQLGLEPCLPGFSVSGSQDYYLTYPSLTGLSRAAGAFRKWLLAEINHSWSADR